MHKINKSSHKHTQRAEGLIVFEPREQAIYALDF